MPDNGIGATLRKLRTACGLDVNTVSEILKAKNFKASVKTIYSWEKGTSQPTPDVLLSLCVLYGVPDVLAAFGYKKAAAPNALELPERERVLVKNFRVAQPDDQAALLRFAKYAAHIAKPEYSEKPDDAIQSIVAHALDEQADLQREDRETVRK